MGDQKPREIAVRLIERWENAEGFLDDLLNAALTTSRLKEVDRRLLQELAYGMLRWRRTLDWLIDRATAGRTQKLTLRILLRLGLYQMFWLGRIPPHALLHETVELAKRRGFGPQAGFINALLRRYLRERQQTEQLLEEIKISQPPLGYSHPDWLARRWEKRWNSEQIRALFSWNNAPPPLFARVNSLKTQPEQLLGLWKKEGVTAIPFEREWLRPGLAYEIRQSPPVRDWPSFQAGLFYLQDPSTLLAVEQLDVQRGQNILDLCAAPGGKTTYISQLLANDGRIVANDPDAHRLNLVRDNCRRLGVTCAVIQQMPSPGEGPETSSAFDRVLIDAPCSNSGVIRRRVDLRWRITEPEIARLTRTQTALLRQGASCVRPGGLLIYSTCSLEPEENSTLVHAVLPELTGLELERELELVPFKDGVDGAYVARIRRV